MSPWKVIKSVLSAMLGVRPAQAAEEDFSQQSVWPFILVGILFVLIFIGTLMLVVKTVLA